MILFFDTETTGKADFRAEPDAPHQPRLVQFAALLCEDNGDEVGLASLIIRPHQFTIPADASAIHGITTQKALDCGVHLESALDLFVSWSTAAKPIVAHNIQFDRWILLGEMMRSGAIKPEYIFHDGFCTMKAMTQMCKLPGNYGDYKWPKLIEAYRHCFGCDFDKAHDALADVLACKKVYFWLKNHEAEVLK